MGRTLTRGALITLAIAAAAGCSWFRGDPPTTVPDTTPGMTDPPAEAMEPCPTAEREGTGSGYLPSAGGGTEGELIRAGSLAARYLATCDNRHETLRRHITEYINEQRGTDNAEPVPPFSGPHP